MSGRERLRRNRPQPKEKAVSRRSFLRLSTALPIGGAVVATAGVSAFLVDRYNKSRAVENKLAEYKRKEAELEEFLPRFEQGYSQFAQEAKKKITERIADPEIRKNLFIPFEVFDLNRGNALKNGYGVKRRDLEERQSLEGWSQLKLGNRNFFLYELWEGERGRAAAFNPLARTLYLPRGYQPHSLLENSVITHELVHAAQDVEDKTTLPPNVYETFHTTKSPSGKNKTIDIYETTAYIEEIEIVNAMTDGQFRELVLAREGNIAKYRNLFNSRSEQDGVATLLIAIAGRYYASPQTTLLQIGQDFLQYMRGVLSAAGFEVYTRTPGGYALVRQ